MLLPHDFLIDIARKHELSLEQQDAFVEWFVSKKRALEIATELHITISTLTTRMGHVYRKFGINGKGPGKRSRLLDLLITEYWKSNTSGSPSSNLSEDELNELVQEVRLQRRNMIQDQCGTMRVLDMSQPIGVSDLYTNVNILENITSHGRSEIYDLLQGCDRENFDRFGLGRLTQRRVSGLEAVEKYPRLIVLGKPGSGKTTFLKHLAIQCNRGEFQAHHVSIFITLKDFAEAEGQPSLLEYITQLFSTCGVAAEQVAGLLKHGRALVLLDGLDEVREEDNSWILKQVRDFSDQFRTNHFVMTCRIAAQDYIFEKFIEVEVADFDDQQMSTFAQNWFQAKDPAKAEEFIQKLRENKPIGELASNPLLLTLLCLVFEQSAKFPSNRSELYEEGVDILLKRWDETRKIERSYVYNLLSLQQKKDLFSQIALNTFERGEVFWKQNFLEQYIYNFIQKLPHAKTAPEEWQLDSKAVLKSIEAQHGLLIERARGIYSFSHLTFQEYFTTREIVFSSDPEAMHTLASHITEYRWREVFLLAAGMMRNADSLLLLMKQHIDKLVATDDELQKFLAWINQKSLTVKVPYKLAAVRAFYFAMSLALDAACPNPYLGLFEEAYDFIFGFAVFLDIKLASDARKPSDIDLDFELARALGDAPIFAHARKLDLEPELEQLLQQLESKRPDRYTCSDLEIYEYWWQDNVQSLTEQLRSVMIKHRNIGHDWQFSDRQKKTLEQYYDANQLLMDCLNSASEVTLAVREEIEETLLLPVPEIENRKHRS